MCNTYDARELSAETDLAALLMRELHVMITPSALGRFVRGNWQAIAKHAHAIHGSTPPEPASNVGKPPAKYKDLSRDDAIQLASAKIVSLQERVERLKHFSFDTEIPMLCGEITALLARA